MFNATRMSALCLFMIFGLSVAQDCVAKRQNRSGSARRYYLGCGYFDGRAEMGTVVLTDPHGRPKENYNVTSVVRSTGSGCFCIGEDPIHQKTQFTKAIIEQENTVFCELVATEVQAEVDRRYRQLGHIKIPQAAGTWRGRVPEAGR